MKMTKNILLIAIILLGVILITGCTSETPKEKIVVITGHQNWFPAMYSNNNGNISGDAIEAARNTFADINVKTISLDVGPWDVAQEKARKGEVVIAALYKTKEREEYLYFSDPYMTDPIVGFVATGNGLAYSKKEDFKGKRGVATIGDSYGQEMDNYIVQANLSLIRVDTPEQAFTLIKEGKADYFLYSKSAGERVIAESGLSGFEETAIISNQLFYIGVPKNSELAGRMEEINRSLKKYSTL